MPYGIVTLVKNDGDIMAKWGKTQDDMTDGPYRVNVDDHVFYKLPNK